jgi:hypothetical protein
MRNAILIVIWAALAVGCSSGDTPPDTTLTVRDYFFPTTNGLVYTYDRAQTDSNRIVTDTLHCVLEVGQLPNSQNALVNQANDSVVYFFSTTHDSYPGNNNAFAATLSTGTRTVYALEGNLLDSDTWIADASDNLQAIVIAHIDDYYPPRTSADVHFSNVIEVKYETIGDPTAEYTLRFFSKGIGLIREAEIVPNGTTEISSLQLTDVKNTE